MIIFSNEFDVNIINCGSHFHFVNKRDIEFEKAVGKKVKEVRESLGWSQSYLGSMANLESNQIGCVENAKYSTSIKILTAIAKAFGKQPYEILKTEYQVDVNTNVVAIKKRPGVPYFIGELIKTPFFDSPRYVKEVVTQCEEIYEQYKVAQASPVTSATLKKFVDKKVLERVPSKAKPGRYLYKKAAK